LFPACPFTWYLFHFILNRLCSVYAIQKDDPFDKSARVRSSSYHGVHQRRSFCTESGPLTRIISASSGTGKLMKVLGSIRRELCLSSAQVIRTSDCSGSLNQLVLEFLKVRLLLSARFLKLHRSDC
jgi:hypothetical protein